MVQQILEILLGGFLYILNNQQIHLGLDINLIKLFVMIYSVIESGCEINTASAFETEHFFVYLYQWYYMPPSMQTILIHISC